MQRALLAPLLALTHTCAALLRALRLFAREIIKWICPRTLVLFRLHALRTRCDWSAYLRHNSVDLLDGGTIRDC